MPDKTFYILPESILLYDSNRIIKKITITKKFKMYHYKPDNNDLLEKLKVVFKI